MRAVVQNPCAGRYAVIIDETQDLATALLQTNYHSTREILIEVI